MPIMKKQTTTLFVYDNCEVNYIIMYRNNEEENYHVKVFIYEWNEDCKEWYKELSGHELFLTYKGALRYFKVLIDNNLMLSNYTI